MDTAIIPDKKSFRANEVANIFDVSPRTVYRWIDEGKLNAKKIANTAIRISRNELTKIIRDTNE